MTTNKTRANANIKLDSLFSVQKIATNGNSSKNKKIQFYTTLKLAREIMNMCAEFNEPIFMVKTHDLSKRLNSGTLIASLFDFLFSLIILQLSLKVPLEIKLEVVNIALEHKIEK